MKKVLNLLAQLQEIDLKADGLQGEKDVVLGEIAGLDQALSDAREAIAAKRLELDDTQSEKVQLEENLATEGENIVRSEARLKEIKTQKEYQAVSKEISSAKKLVTELEEQVLQKLTRSEEIKGEIETLEGNLAKLEENSADRRAEMDERIAALDADVAADAGARAEAVKGIPGSVMRRYAMLREQRRGIAVVEARDGSCLGCNMHLPPQLYNTLYRNDDIVTCPHCQRVLILKLEAQG